jgi:hypothetical protein
MFCEKPLACVWVNMLHLSMALASRTIVSPQTVGVKHSGRPMMSGHLAGMVFSEALNSFKN